VLLVVVVLLTPVTIAVLYLRAAVTDTDRYVATVRPLASDPAIQRYAAERATGELFARVDVEARVRSVLPERAEALAPPITAALRTYVDDLALGVVRSERFEDVWVSANRRAHAEIVAVLTGRDTGVLGGAGDAVTLDLSPVVAEVRRRLAAAGVGFFERIPLEGIGRDVVVFRAPELARVRRAVGVLETAAFLLPVALTAAFGGAILLAADRRHGFIAAATCLTIGAAILGLGLTVARRLSLEAAGGRDVPADAAAAFFDTLVRSLRRAVRSVYTLSAVVVVGAVASGPGRFVTWLRTRAGAAARWLGDRGVAAGVGWLAPVPFVARHRRVLRAVVGVAAVAVLVWWPRPTPLVVVGLAAGALGGLAVIEVFGRPPGEVPADAR
jgi:hypothetical protein